MFEKEAAAAAVASLPAPHSPARNWFSASSHFHVFAAAAVTAIRKLLASVGFPFDWLHVGILNHFCGLWSPLSECGHSPKPSSNIRRVSWVFGNISSMPTDLEHRFVARLRARVGEATCPPLSRPSEEQKTSCFASPFLLFVDETSHFLMACRWLHGSGARRGSSGRPRARARSLIEPKPALARLLAARRTGVCVGRARREVAWLIGGDKIL